MLGFVSTAMKGIIDATPNISIKAIVNIIINNRPALFFFEIDRKKKSFLKVFIWIFQNVNRF